MSKLEYVQEQIQDQINFFTKKRNLNRRGVLTTSISTAALSALATVLIGTAKIVADERLTIVALIATGATAVISAWGTIIAYRNLWAINNRVLADLYKLKREIDYKVAGNDPISDNDADQWFTSFNQIITAADEAWVKVYAVS